MHKLPTNPPGLIPAFEKLCSSFPPDSIPDLRKGVDATLDRLTRMKDDYLGPNLDTAQEIAKRMCYLIENYQNYPADKHPLIVGALRYFIIEQDSLPDQRPIIGFDDDIRVLNYVLEQLGISGMFLDVPGQE